jgi:hypothetical protein
VRSPLPLDRPLSTMWVPLSHLRMLVRLCESAPELLSWSVKSLRIAGRDQDDCAPKIEGGFVVASSLELSILKIQQAGLSPSLKETSQIVSLRFGKPSGTSRRFNVSTSSV